ncbi:Nuclear transport factor 2 [Mortierella sp. GBA35]|nr:Nuclear transport factor 2 [Mortierella sp. AD031]KAF9107635.1 Nuclear transport factor 2 [Mortierella sp. GBA35]KAG0217059.1 Nuclear transport factor 2 [Mortierella sp. NVP41]
MADINAIADQFTTYYYQTFDANRAGLGPLYRPTSMLSFEGAQTLGADAIVEKLANLPLDGLRHQIATNDVQPVGADILILVSGQLLAGGETNPQFFTQTFLLKSDGANYYIQNDVFRLVYGL